MNFHLKEKFWKGYIKSKEIQLQKLHALLNIISQSHAPKLKFDKNWKLLGISAYLEILSNKMDKTCAKNKTNFPHLFKYLNFTEWERAAQYFKCGRLLVALVYMSLSLHIFSEFSVADWDLVSS